MRTRGRGVETAWTWGGDGMDMGWRWHGCGVEMAWIRGGDGMDVGWRWHGHGVEMAWTWGRDGMSRRDTGTQNGHEASRPMAVGLHGCGVEMAGT